MEENLAREMARMKVDTEKKSREIEKICAESPELRELQNKIKSAYLNKERATQVTEHQYRKQIEVVSLSYLLGSPIKWEPLNNPILRKVITITVSLHTTTTLTVIV